MLIRIELLLRKRSVARILGSQLLEGKHLRLGYLNPLLGDMYLGSKYLFGHLNLAMLASMQYIQQ
jgi:hypothetical protein